MASNQRQGASSIPAAPVFTNSSYNGSSSAPQTVSYTTPQSTQGLTSILYSPSASNSSLDSNILSLMDQARSSYTEGASYKANSILTGLQYYQGALNDAASTVQDYLNKSVNTLKPLSDASRTAQDEYMRFLGLTPPSQGSNLGGELSSLNNQLKGYGASGLDTDLQKLIPQLQTSDSLSSDARQGLKNQLDSFTQKGVDNLNAYKTTQLNNFTTQASQLGQQAATFQGQATTYKNQATQYQQGLLSAQTGYQQMVANINNYKTANANLLAGNGVASNNAKATLANLQNQAAQYANAASSYNTAYTNSMAQYNKANQSLSGINTQIQGINTQKQQFTDQFNSNLQAYQTAGGQVDNQFESNWAPGYTADQVTNMLQATPGYQSQFDAGTKAVERSAAAAGMLGSGNTLAALTKYGQNLAEGTYQDRLNNLQSIVATGVDATTAIANNQNAAGGYLANLKAQYGQGALGAYGDIGTAWMDAFNQMGGSYQSQAQLAQQQAQENAKMQLSYDQLNSQNQLGYAQINSENNAQKARAIASLPDPYATAKSNSTFSFLDDPNKMSSGSGSLGLYTQAAKESEDRAASIRGLF